METKYNVSEINLRGENRKLPVVKHEVETSLWPVEDYRVL